MVEPGSPRREAYPRRSAPSSLRSQLNHQPGAPGLYISISEETGSLLRVGGVRLVRQFLVDRAARDYREVDEDGDAEDDADDGPYARHVGLLLCWYITAGRLVVLERVDGRADAGVDDDLEERRGGADSVRPESERGGRGEEAVHNIVWVRREAHEEEQFRAFLDGADDALDRACGLEPPRNTIAEERS